MYINLQQNWLVDQSKPCAQIYLQKTASCINLQLQIKDFKNQLFQKCGVVKGTCMSIFSKIGLIDQSKSCTQIYLPKNANCINLPIAIRISKNHTFPTCTTA